MAFTVLLCNVNTVMVSSIWLTFTRNVGAMSHMLVCMPATDSYNANITSNKVLL